MHILIDIDMMNGCLVSNTIVNYHIIQDTRANTASATCKFEDDILRVID
jgi:hypothetical protein